METLPLLIATLSCIATIGLFGGIIRARFQRRAKEISTTRELLREHLAALDRVASDPASPERMKRMAVNFSDIICQKESVADMLSILQEGREGHQPRVDTSLLREIDALRSSRSDLVDDFYLTISSGLLAAFMRWPSLGEAFQNGATVLVDSRREVTFAARLIKTSEARKAVGPFAPQPFTPGYATA